MTKFSRRKFFELVAAASATALANNLPSVSAQTSTPEVAEVNIHDWSEIINLIERKEFAQLINLISQTELYTGDTEIFNRHADSLILNDNIIFSGYARRVNDDELEAIFEGIDPNNFILTISSISPVLDDYGKQNVDGVARQDYRTTLIKEDGKLFIRTVLSLNLHREGEFAGMFEIDALQSADGIEYQIIPIEYIPESYTQNEVVNIIIDHLDESYPQLGFEIYLNHIGGEVTQELQGELEDQLA